MEIVCCFRCGRPRWLCNTKHFFLGWIWPLIWGSFVGGLAGAIVYYITYTVIPFINK